MSLINLLSGDLGAEFHLRKGLTETNDGFKLTDGDGDCVSSNGFLSKSLLPVLDVKSLEFLCCVLS